MKIGEILVVKDDKLLVLNNNRYYIVKGHGKVGDQVEFDLEKALPMPSYLFAIAAIEYEDLEQTMKFIKSEWFKD
jgi:aminopeptidase N